MRTVSRRLEGAFTLVAAHVAEPDTLVASRRNSPLVVGVGDGEYFLGSDVAAFIAHTRNALELGQDQVVELHRERGVTVTDFAGTAVEPTAYSVDWDAAAAEKGGYDWFMLKEIAEQPQAVADTLLGRLGAARRARARRGAAVRPGAARRRQGLRRRLRYRVPRGADRQVRHRALDPHPGRGRAGQRVPLPRPGAGPLHAGRRRQPVRRDDGHADGAAARQGAEGPGAGHLQRQRLDDPARVRRRPLHPRRSRGRGRLDQGLPHPGGRLLPGRAVPRPGARRQVRRRGRRHRRRPARAARRRRAGAGRHGAGARAGPRPGRREDTCCSSAGTSATRWPWRARSSSRSWPTSTPRGSPPASSSTGRSR